MCTHIIVGWIYDNRMSLSLKTLKGPLRYSYLCLWSNYEGGQCGSTWKGSCCRMMCDRHDSH